MPRNREYIDSFARIGRPKLAPEKETTVKILNSSRSLQDITRLISIERRKTGYYHFDASLIIGGKFKISKTNMVKLAKWVLDGVGNSKRDSKG